MAQVPRSLQDLKAEFILIDDGGDDQVLATHLETWLKRELAALARAAALPVAHGDQKNVLAATLVTGKVAVRSLVIPQQPNAPNPPNPNPPNPPNPNPLNPPDPILPDPAPVPVVVVAGKRSAEEVQGLLDELAAKKRRIEAKKISKKLFPKPKASGKEFHTLSVINKMCRGLHTIRVLLADEEHVFTSQELHDSIEKIEEKGRERLMRLKLAEEQGWATALAIPEAGVSIYQDQRFLKFAKESKKLANLSSGGKREKAKKTGGGVYGGGQRPSSAPTYGGPQYGGGTSRGVVSAHADKRCYKCGGWGHISPNCMAFYPVGPVSSNNSAGFNNGFNNMSNGNIVIPYNQASPAGKGGAFHK